MLDWDDLKYFLEVARTQRVSTAGIRLGVQHTTVSRRVQNLERELNTVLFNKSTAGGFTLTTEGEHFFAYAEQMEGLLIAAQESFQGQGHAISGHLRVGATEGFGNYVLAPLMVDFQERFPAITLDILPVPRFISLSKREADLAVSLERPQRGPYLCTKLLDYALKLYATPAYLARHPPIQTLNDLQQHRFIGYVEELLFSDRLRYLDDLASPEQVVFKSTSVIAQYHAALQGKALAILPCFMAEQFPGLQVVLAEQVQVTRSFWMYCHKDLRNSARVMALWNYLKYAVQLNQPLMQGVANAVVIPDSSPCS